MGEQIWRRHADQLRAREEMDTAVTKKSNQMEDHDINWPDSAVDATESANCFGTEPVDNSSNSSSTS